MGKAAGTAAGAGGGALSGAAAGSIFGPIGTGVGALVGAVGGGFLGSQAGDAPEYKLPPKNPLFDQLSQQAEEDKKLAMTNRAQMDTASIMSRYGQRLALAGTSGTAPLAAMGK